MTRTGDLAMVQGDFERAAELQEASIALARAAGGGPTLTYAVGFRGLTALHQGDLDLAEARLTQAVALAQTAGPLAWAPSALGLLASIARRRGEHAREAALLEESLAICRTGINAWHTPIILSQVSDLAVDRNEVRHADTLYREALAQLVAVGDHRHVAGVLAGLAWTAAHDDPRRAARLCGAVDALLGLTGVRLAPDGHLRHERALAMAGAGLGARAFAAAHAAGRALSLAQAQAEIHQSPAPAFAPAARPVASFGLTERELTVLHLLPANTYREIASQLFISERTVEHHVRGICAKLGVHHRRDAVTVARQRDLIP